jgi:hypothetical protein
VEQALKEDSRVADAAAVIQIDPFDEDPYLVAFIVRKDVKQVSNISLDPVIESELQAAMAQTLPQFMIPTYIATIDAIPRLANDKTDRKILSTWTDLFQLPPEDAVEVSDPESWSDLQALIVRVFREILKHRRSQITLDSKYVLHLLTAKSLPRLVTFPASSTKVVTVSLRRGLSLVSVLSEGWINVYLCGLCSMSQHPGG